VEAASSVHGWHVKESRTGIDIWLAVVEGCWVDFFGRATLISFLAE